MLQNIKVDIIYYLTNTDFEMEFNLCGCCRMRLLTDKASDRKGFINMLSRAVSRSRIIIACGGLFSETGLIQTVAQAVGRPLEVADNKAYGIKDNSEIKIISGSIPLVTPEGYFGGCIIESGPQTIILLSESRNIRKSIMQNLIHPYIEEFSMNAASESSARGAHAVPTAVVSEPAVVPTPVDLPTTDDVVPTEEQEVVSEETAEQEMSDENTAEDIQDTVESEEQENVHETVEIPADQDTPADNDDNTFEFVFEEDEVEQDIPVPVELATEETDIPMHLVPERMKPSKTNYYDIEYKVQEGSDLYLSEGDQNLKKHRSFTVPFVISAFILAVILLALVYFLVIVPISGGYTIPQYFNSLFNVSVNLAALL